MNTQIEILNAQILDITMLIKKQYPELSLFIEEMPVSIPNKEYPEITVKNLTTYLESLVELKLKYQETHSGQ